MESIVVYRNRIEVKILSIVVGIIWGPLYAFVLISDIWAQNPHFWHNQMCILLIGLVFCIPVLIYRRFRIEFHFADRSIIYVGYFTRKKHYSFDEVIVSTKKSKGFIPYPQYVFTRNEKKLFQFSELDFEGQTHVGIDCLKQLFRGDAKFLYDVEQSVEKAGYVFHVYDYALAETIGVVSNTYRHPPNPHPHWIKVGFLSENGMYSLKVQKNELDENSIVRTKVIEEVTAEPHSLEKCILQLADQYL